MQCFYNNAILKPSLHEYATTVGQLQAKRIGIAEGARRNRGVQRYLTSSPKKALGTDKLSFTILRRAYNA